MVNLGIVQSNSILLSPYFWLLIIVGVVGILVAVLMIRRKRAFYQEVLELVDLGNDKIDFVTNKAGKVGRTLYFKGMFWAGPKTWMTMDGCEIEEARTLDYHYMNGKKMFLVYRHPSRTNVLIPVPKAKFHGKEFIASIAPGDFSDVAGRIYNQTKNEISSWTDKILPIAGIIIVAGISFLILLLTIQAAKGMLADAAKNNVQCLTQSASLFKEACKEVVQASLGR